MTIEKTKEDWEKQKVKLLARFAQLTSEDVQYVKGKRDEMMVKLEVRLNKNREHMMDILSSL